MYPQLSTTYNATATNDIADEVRQAVCSTLSSGNLIKFSGRPDQSILPWLDEFEIHCELKGRKDPKITLHIAQFLTGPALQWYLLNIRPLQNLPTWI